MIYGWEENKLELYENKLSRKIKIKQKSIFMKPPKKVNVTVKFTVYRYSLLIFSLINFKDRVYLEAYGLRLRFYHSNSLQLIFTFTF